MATLFPAMEPSAIENDGERFIARALVEQLPDEVEVIHSFHWLRENAYGTLSPGECDFVLLDPARGMLFVEVKSGSLGFDNGHWWREPRGGGREILTRDPFEQAQRSMHAIVGLVAERLRVKVGELPFTYGHAAAFPDSELSGRPPASTHPGLVLDATKLRALPEAIDWIFTRSRRREHPPLKPRELQEVREALFPRFRLVPSLLSHRIEAQNERLQRLTEEQHLLMEAIAGHPRAAIEGVAGSGKTLLAVAKAREKARQGQRTLLLCYNRALKDWLEQEIGDEFDGQLVVQNYHGLVDTLCQATGVPFLEGRDTKDQSLWEDDAPECLLQACARLTPEQKFDAVIVDEGQDFRELWWASLEEVFRDPENKGCWYVFSDPRQNLYVENPTLPPELSAQPAFQLARNCRNTAHIAQHCATLMGHEPLVREGAPEGDVPEMVEVDTLEEAFAAAGRQVRKWCTPNPGGLPMSRVAVLAPAYAREDWPHDFGAVPATDDYGAWQDGAAVLIATLQQFKGLEADAVVTIEPPLKGRAASHENEQHYVARSRAKHLLTVIRVREG